MVPREGRDRLFDTPDDVHAVLLIHPATLPLSDLLSISSVATMSNTSDSVARRETLIVAVLGEDLKPIAAELASDDPSRIAGIRPEGNITQAMLDRAKLVNELSKIFDDDKTVIEIATDLTVTSVRDVALHYDKDRLAKLHSGAASVLSPHNQLTVGDQRFDGKRLSRWA